MRAIGQRHSAVGRGRDGGAIDSDLNGRRGGAIRGRNLDRVVVGDAVGGRGVVGTGISDGDANRRRRGVDGDRGFDCFAIAGGVAGSNGNRMGAIGKRNSAVGRGRDGGAIDSDMNGWRGGAIRGSNLDRVDVGLEIISWRTVGTWVGDNNADICRFLEVIGILFHGSHARSSVRRAGEIRCSL